MTDIDKKKYVYDLKELLVGSMMTSKHLSDQIDLLEERLRNMEKSRDKVLEDGRKEITKLNAVISAHVLSK